MRAATRRAVLALTVAGLLAGGCSDDTDTPDAADTTEATSDTSATTPSGTADLPGEGRLVLPPRMNPDIAADPFPEVEKMTQSLRRGPIALDELTDQDLITLAVTTCEFFDLDSPPPAEANAAVMRFLAGRITFEGLQRQPDDPEILTVLSAYLGAATPQSPPDDLIHAVNGLALWATRLSCPEHADKLDFEPDEEAGYPVPSP